MGRNVHQAHTVGDQLAFLLLILCEADAHLHDVPLVDVQEVRPYSRLLEVGVVHHLLLESRVDLLVVGVACGGSPCALLGELRGGLQEPLRCLGVESYLHGLQVAEVVPLRLGQQSRGYEGLREHVRGKVANHLDGPVVGLVGKGCQLLAVLLGHDPLHLGVVEGGYKLVNLGGDPLHGGCPVLLEEGFFQAPCLDADLQLLGDLLVPIG